MKRVGIVGGGQLARMLALAGHPLGVRCRVLDPSDRPSAGEVAEHVQGGFEDIDALRRLAEGVDVVTYETEGVPAAASEELAQHAPLLPHPRALSVASDRLEEKRFLRGLGLATAPFVRVESFADLEIAIERIGFPLVLKTRRHGYDGRGQAVIARSSDAPAAWERLGPSALIAEAFIRFERELSVVAVRSTSGALRAYPLVENLHREGILVWTLAPAPRVDAAMQGAAEAIAASIMESLDYVGVLTVEMFQCGGELVVNEIAPRVHNSGHWTIEGAATSQFENHLRAILSLPLGSTSPHGASVSVNLLGEVPEIDQILALPDTHVHLYGKVSRPRRKIGHVTLRAGSHDEARQRLECLMRLS